MRLVKYVEPSLTPSHIDGTKQGKIMSIFEAAGIQGNSKINPHNDLGGKYMENCQSCIIAYELRRRGYDVESKSLNMLGEFLSYSPEMAFIDPETSLNPVVKEYAIEMLQSESDINDLVKSIDKQIKSGQRYVLGWNWLNKQNGHIVNIEKSTRGTLILLDNQTGEIAIGADRFWPDYFGKCEAISNVYMFRSSEMILNPAIMEVVQKSKKPVSKHEVLALKKALSRIRTMKMNLA